MTLHPAFARYVFCGLLAIAMSGPAVAADKKTTNTILGAGLGAAAGAVLSQGDPMLTIGSAAAGGVLGHILTEDEKRYDRSHRRYSKGPKHHYVNKHNGHGHHKHKKHRKHKRHYR